MQHSISAYQMRNLLAPDRDNARAIDRENAKRRKQRQAVDPATARDAALWRLRGLMESGVPKLEDVERVMIEYALAVHGNQGAASDLGIGVRTIYDKLKHYDLAGDLTL